VAIVTAPRTGITANVAAGMAPLETGLSSE
jgi:hypothetical protein